MSKFDSNEQQGLMARSSGPLATEPHAADVAASATRRRLAKLGLSAPVLMTLASRPVLAGQCLSNMLSGNLSDPTRGHCSKGWSPGGWGLLGGMIGGFSTADAWVKAGFNFHTSKLSAFPSSLIKNPLDLNTLAKDVVANDVTPNKPTRHYLAAYLNASLSEATGSTFQYILTKQQVIELATGAIKPPPPNENLSIYQMNEFLDKTWV